MVDAATIEAPLDRVKALFAAEGLAFPPLPPSAATSLRAESDTVFTTRDLPAGPYNLEVFSTELLVGGKPADYAVLGFDGHGTNSWAVHYFNVEGPLGLFIQLPWGGAYVDPEQARGVIGRAFDWATRIQESVRGLGAKGLIPAGWRIVIVASQFAQPGWAFVPPIVAEESPVELQRAPSLAKAVEDMLTDIAAGNTKVG